MARQAIYDSRLRPVAYELLFRPMSDAGVQLRDADAATAQVLLTAFSDVGLDNLVGAHRAFVNVPVRVPHRRLVPGAADRPRRAGDPRGRARSIATSWTWPGRLVADGHTLALDDFVFRDGIEALVELADIVKLDVLALSRTELARQIELLRPFGVTLLAEKVETADQIDELREMGFEYFQGFALQRPTTVRARSDGRQPGGAGADPLRAARPRVTTADLVDTVGRDPSIVYALLRILNSAHLSLERRSPRSIRRSSSSVSTGSAAGPR